MTRLRTLAVLAVLSLIVAASAFAASATSTSTSLAGGDALTVNSSGAGRLVHTRLSRSSVKDFCAKTTPRTNNPPVTTAAPGTTQPPATTAPSSPSPGTSRCTSSPSGSLGPFSSSNIANSNGYNTYVGNNMWAANSGTTQSVCGTGPGNWTITANAGPSGYSGVQTYPDVQQLMNNWTGSSWGSCGASNCTDTPLAKLKTLTSSYSITNPPVSVGNWQAAYDIWLNNSPRSEIMIWVYTSDSRGTGGAQIIAPNVTVGGQQYRYQNYGGGLPQMVLLTNQASANIDILGVLNYLKTQGQVSDSATIGQIDFGWEICSTVGTQTFSVNAFSLSAT